MGVDPNGQHRPHDLIRERSILRRNPTHEPDRRSGRLQRATIPVIGIGVGIGIGIGIGIGG